MADGKLYRQTALLSSIGVTFAVAAGGGFWLGSYLDTKFGTAPILTLVLGLLGVAAAFVNLYRVIKASERIGKEAAPSEDGSDDDQRAG